jgi:hypothetical protein
MTMKSSSPRKRGSIFRRVCGGYDSYARYRARWIPAFAGMTILFLVSLARAADQCYSPDQMDAEQLLRLHSELMVITVTCHQGSHGENLVPAYTSFTKTNIKALHAAEKTMIAYYHSVYGGDGIPKLDELRTRLGNEYGSKIAEMSAPVFCAMYRDKVLQMCTANRAILKEEVERIASEGKSGANMCVANPDK